MVETKSIATAFREHGGHGNHMWLPCERDAFIALRNIKKIETILYGARFYQALRQRCNRGVTAYIINPATSNIHRMYERSVTQNVTFSSPPLLHHKSARDSWNICGGSHNSAHSLCDVQKCTTSYPRTISTPSYAHANNTHLLRFGVILLIFFFSFSSLYRIKWWPRASSLTT